MSDLLGPDSAIFDVLSTFVQGMMGSGSKRILRIRITYGAFIPLRLRAEKFI